MAALANCLPLKSTVPIVIRITTDESCGRIACMLKVLAIVLGVGMSNQLPDDLILGLPDLQIFYIGYNPGELECVCCRGSTSCLVQLRNLLQSVFDNVKALHMHAFGICSDAVIWGPVCTTWAISSLVRLKRASFNPETEASNGK